MTAARTYRLSPPDRTGWLLGLAAPQVVSLALAVVAGALLLSMSGSLALAAPPALIGALAGLGRLNGRPVLESVPAGCRLLARIVRRQRTWHAPLPPLAGTDGTALSLPPCLAGQVVLPADPATFGFVDNGEPIAVVHDGRSALVAASVSVSGQEFALVERAEQDRLVGLWGDAIAAFCRDRSGVASVRWSEWAAPAGIEEQYAFLAEHGSADPDEGARRSYEALLAAAGPLATRHEVLVTLTVSTARVRVAPRHEGDRTAAAVEALLGELRLFTSRMETASLTVSTPLSPRRLARALRVRLDPTVAGALDRRGRTLGDRAGLVRLQNAGPLAAAAAWTHWQVDGALHRSFYVADWPRMEVSADWMRDLLLGAGTVQTVTVSYEPVAPQASQRTIERQAAKLESDEDQRRRTGFRVGAHHRRAAQAVADREEELVAGYAELEYVGLVSVTASNGDELERSCAETVQRAAACGIDLRALDGRHDQAVAAALPLARGLAARRGRA